MAVTRFFNFLAEAMAMRERAKRQQISVALWLCDQSRSRWPCVMPAPTRCARPPRGIASRRDGDVDRERARGRGREDPDLVDAGFVVEVREAVLVGIRAARARDHAGRFSVGALDGDHDLIGREVLAELVAELDAKAVVA